MYPQNQSSHSKLVRFMRSRLGGIIKTDSQANTVLVVLAVVLLALSVYLFSGAGSGVQPVPPEDLPADHRA